MANRKLKYPPTASMKERIYHLKSSLERDIIKAPDLLSIKRLTENLIIQFLKDKLPYQFPFKYQKGAHLHKIRTEWRVNEGYGEYFVSGERLRSIRIIYLYKTPLSCNPPYGNCLRLRPQIEEAINNQYQSLNLIGNITIEELPLLSKKVESQDTTMWANFIRYRINIALNYGFYFKELSFLHKMINPFTLSYDFEINQYLKLRLERGTTCIYVNDEKFKQCKYLLLNIPKEEAEKTFEINSIDEAEQFYNNDYEMNPHDYNITPSQEFQAHCSNLQAWYEHDYDTRLLHRNLAFPLLKKLSSVGDKKAKSVLREEIVQRAISGNFTVIQYLFEENYIEYLTNEEKEVLFRELDPKELNIPLSTNILSFLKLLLPYDTSLPFPQMTSREAYWTYEYYKKLLSLEITFLPKIIQKVAAEYNMLTKGHLSYCNYSRIMVPKLLKIKQLIIKKIKQIEFSALSSLTTFRILYYLSKYFRQDHNLKRTLAHQVYKKIKSEDLIPDFYFELKLEEYTAFLSYFTIQELKELIEVYRNTPLSSAADSLKTHILSRKGLSKWTELKNKINEGGKL